MSIRPVDVVMMQQMNEVSNIKHNEMTKPAVQQFDITAQLEKKVEIQAEQVTEKADADNRKKKFDAKDKSDNEYEGKRKKRTHAEEDIDLQEDGHVTLKSMSSSLFDIKI